MRNKWYFLFDFHNFGKQSVGLLEDSDVHWFWAIRPPNLRSYCWQRQKLKAFFFISKKVLSGRSSSDLQQQNSACVKTEQKSFRKTMFWTVFEFPQFIWNKATEMQCWSQKKTKKLLNYFLDNSPQCLESNIYWKTRVFAVFPHAAESSTAENKKKHSVLPHSQLPLFYIPAPKDCCPWLIIADTPKLT